MRRLISVTISLLLAAAGFTAPAHATPPDVIGLAELRDLLDANPGGIQGYYKTVLGGPTSAQQDPVDIGMTVLAVADQTGPEGSLIMFRSDPIGNVPNIAQGMSGSPLYIDDNGSDKVIGALSYGDSFTVGGLGLATPIEYMIATQTQYPPAVSATLRLDREVDVEGAAIRKVAVTTGDKAATASDTVTVRPLFGLHVSGIPQGSAVYKHFESTARTKGMSVRAGSGGQCSQAGFAAPYVAGGSLGAYYTRGDAEIGGYGTVTYVDGDDVMGFGHPMDWVGDTDLFATSVWISGIWGSSDTSYKVGCAGQDQGALTQDRASAVGVDRSAATSSIPATADVRLTRDTTRTDSGRTRIAAGTFAAGYGPDAVAMAVTAPVYRLANQVAMAGSARTTTTVSITDGATSATITRPNLWSGSDVLAASGADAAMLVATLEGSPGITPHIDSVHVDAAIDRTTRDASITAVTGGPLQVGLNSVTVSIKPVGKPVVRIPVTFTVPPGVALDGGLSVIAGGVGSDDSEVPAFDSLQSMLDWLKGLPSNDQLVLAMYDKNGDAVEVGRATTDYVLDGAVDVSSSSGTLYASADQVTLGDSVDLLAMASVPDGTPVTLEQAVAGGAWQTVGSSQVVTGSDATSGAQFSVEPTANTLYRASGPGGAGVLAWRAQAAVTVVPPLALSGSRKGHSWSFSVRSAPAVAGQPVAVQAKQHGSWQTVSSGALDSRGHAALSWRTGPASAKARAIIPESVRLAGVTSEPIALSATTLRINPDARVTAKGNVTVGLRSAAGKALSGIRFRVQRHSHGSWQPAANGTLRRTTRLWLGNGSYRVTVPKQGGVPAQTRQQFTMTARVSIVEATGGRGSASVQVLTPVRLRFILQRQVAGRWLRVGPVRRVKAQWSEPLKAGRYRFAFPQQSGFGESRSDPVRVR